METSQRIYLANKYLPYTTQNVTDKTYILSCQIAESSGTNIELWYEKISNFLFDSIESIENDDPVYIS